MDGHDALYLPLRTEVEQQAEALLPLEIEPGVKAALRAFYDELRARGQLTPHSDGYPACIR